MPPPAAGQGGMGLGRPTFSEMMMTDLIPTIESSYRVLPGRENRAMAGLSMGSGGPGGSAGTIDLKTACGGAFADPAPSIRR